MYSHFVYIPKLIEADVREYDYGITVKCVSSYSGYNYAYLHKSSECYSDNEIISLIKIFNKKKFICIAGLSDSTEDVSNDASKRLQKLGFSKKDNLYAMTCNLLYCNKRCNNDILKIKEVDDLESLKHFLFLLRQKDIRLFDFYSRIKNPALLIDEKLFVGYNARGKPTTISMLYIDVDATYISRLFTLKEERCNGYGSAMMTFLINLSAQMKKKIATLLAVGEVNAKLYSKLKFEEVGYLEYYEWNNNVI
ncbi:MAG: GNAT family N-acetyltransferase [Proteobacteria bacterium]|nr:GNAT family N-acetyltransferase [Pseudomonadota bacterium]